VNIISIIHGCGVAVFIGVMFPSLLSENHIHLLLLLLLLQHCENVPLILPNFVIIIMCKVKTWEKTATGHSDSKCKKLEFRKDVWLQIYVFSI